MNTILYTHGSFSKPKGKSVISYSINNKVHPSGFIQQKVFICASPYEAQLQAIVYGLADIDNYDDDGNNVIVYTIAESIAKVWRSIQEGSIKTFAHQYYFDKIIDYEKLGNKVQIEYGADFHVLKLQNINQRHIKELV